MADLRESAERVQRRSKLVPTLVPRLGVGLGRKGPGLGCAIAENVRSTILLNSEPHY